MEFGVVLQPNPPASGLIAMMKRAEAAGFGYGWTFDSHVLWQETFVLYPRILAVDVDDDRRADGHQPGDAGLVGDRVDVRHAERRVRQPDDLRHRPRRLGPPVHRPGRRSRWPPCRTAMTVIKELAEGREVEPPRPAAADPVGARPARCRSGWRPTGRRRCGWSASRPTASSCRPPTRTSRAGRSARCARRRGTPGATRRRSRCAWPRRPTWARTSRTSGTSCAGSAAWSATTSPTWSPATAPTGRCRAR